MNDTATIPTQVMQLLRQLPADDQLKILKLSAVLVRKQHQRRQLETALQED